MNRLKLMRAYLVGPMDNVEDRGATWRQEMSKWLLSRGVIPLNPADKPILADGFGTYGSKDSKDTNWGLNGIEDEETAALRDKLISEGQYSKAALIMKEIRRVDLRMVDHSDFIVVNLDLDVGMCGTWEELFTSNFQRHPVIVRCKQGKKNMPPWLFAAIPHELMFDCWGEVKDYLDHVNTGCFVNTMDRWHFFDIEDMVREILSLSKDQSQMKQGDVYEA